MSINFGLNSHGIVSDSKQRSKLSNHVLNQNSMLNQSNLFSRNQQQKYSQLDELVDMSMNSNGKEQAFQNKNSQLKMGQKDILKENQNQSGTLNNRSVLNSNFPAKQSSKTFKGLQNKLTTRKQNKNQQKQQGNFVINSKGSIQSKNNQNQIVKSVQQNLWTSEANRSISLNKNSNTSNQKHSQQQQLQQSNNLVEKNNVSYPCKQYDSTNHDGNGNQNYGIMFQNQNKSAFHYKEKSNLSGPYSEDKILQKQQNDLGLVPDNNFSQQYSDPFPDINSQISQNNKDVQLVNNYLHENGPISKIKEESKIPNKNQLSLKQNQQDYFPNDVLNQSQHTSKGQVCLMNLNQDSLVNKSWQNSQVKNDRQQSLISVAKHMDLSSNYKGGLRAQSKPKCNDSLLYSSHGQKTLSNKYSDINNIPTSQRNNSNIHQIPIQTYNQTYNKKQIKANEHINYGADKSKQESILGKLSTPDHSCDEIEFKKTDSYLKQEEKSDLVKKSLFRHQQSQGKGLQFTEKDSQIQSHLNKQPSFILNQQDSQISQKSLLPDRNQDYKQFAQGMENSSRTYKQDKTSSLIKAESNIRQSKLGRHEHLNNSYRESNVHIDQEIIRSRKDSQDHQQYIFQSQNFQIQKQPFNRKRVGTQCNQNVNEKVTPQRFTQIKSQNINKKQPQNSNSLFQTQIFLTNSSLANSKLSKIRQAKQFKKKKLQQQLAKISRQINHLNKKQQQIRQLGSPTKNFNERLKINNNLQARQKAISLVKNLQKQRKNRQLQKVSSIQKIDGKITDYMSQLTNMRTQNEKKLKEKKKLQIIQRMKIKQIKKINQTKKIQVNSKFVSQFSKNHQARPSKQNLLGPMDVRDTNSPLSRKRTQSKIDGFDQALTPQLANKKAYLNKLRNLSQNKNRFEHKVAEQTNSYENRLY